MGLVMQPKPVTELDRLSFVFNKIADNFAVPKGFCKFIPAQKLVRNEAFKGLNKDQMYALENWQFMRSPRSVAIKDMIARGEATYSSECQDCVADDLPKNSWTIHQDATSTVATLKSLLWPGLYAFHRCNTNISGFVYLGDGLRNDNLPFMI